MFAQIEQDAKLKSEMKTSFIMEAKKLERYKNEYQDWLETLDRIQLEIVFLKNHIADIVSKGVNAEKLEKLEYFQNNFLNKDLIIALLRRDIRHQYDILGDKKIIESGKLTAQIDEVQRTLREDIGKMEKEVGYLKTEFSIFFA